MGAASPQQLSSRYAARREIDREGWHVAFFWDCRFARLVRFVGVDVCLCGCVCVGARSTVTPPMNRHLQNPRLAVRWIPCGGRTHNFVAFSKNVSLPQATLEGKASCIAIFGNCFPLFQAWDENSAFIWHKCLRECSQRVIVFTVCCFVFFVCGILDCLWDHRFQVVRRFEKASVNSGETIHVVASTLVRSCVGPTLGQRCAMFVSRGRVDAARGLGG